MADEEKKIIVDDDWKAQARAEKERLAQETESSAADGMPEPSFTELVNMLVMQALVGLGAMQGADGQPIPPNLGVAKHFIDLIQVLDDKTGDKLTAEEKTLLDQALYELRMRYVEMATGSRPAGGPVPPPTA